MEPTRKRLKPGPKVKEQFFGEATKEPGIMPLDYMLSVIRDETTTQARRDRMAVAAAPYCHPRLIPTKPAGKKQKQVDAVAVAGVGTSWSRDLAVEDRPN